MIMNEYENIFSILKECSEEPRTKHIEDHLKSLSLQKNRLIQLINFENIESIQAAVDEKMGPKLCDNSQKESKQTKRSFLSVLADYKKEIITKINQDEKQTERSKEALNFKLLEIQQQFEKMRVKTAQDIEMSKRKKEKIKYFCQGIQSIVKDQSLSREQNQIHTLEDQIQIELLELQLRQRKYMGHILSLVSNMHLQS